MSSIIMMLDFSTEFMGMEKNVEIILHQLYIKQYNVNRVPVKFTYKLKSIYFDIYNADILCSQFVLLYKL